MDSALHSNTEQFEGSLRCNIRAHDSAVRSIAWHGVQDPVNIVSTGNDGALNVHDIRDPFVTMSLLRSRGFLYTCTWPGITDMLLYVDGENMCRTMRTTDGPETGATIKTFDSLGFVWSLSSSLQHTFTAAGTVDGWVKMLNTLQKRKKSGLAVQQILYKLQYDSASNEFRYVDGITPEYWEKNKQDVTYEPFVDMKLNIQRIAWNNNRRTSGWVASAASAGLCRIEFVGRGPGWE
ncbi:hypothetical protein EC973_002374 [Apophysomyces ossiformis]|uniref:Uncharacterized protein n=1 Tax=Apophysomyces ossiformis TaxID=679940 RepID=A0A8H7EML6_9FUNG|nr:hypothetical protein EC973_002374 [Apophysomyces ossiformis]